MRDGNDFRCVRKRSGYGENNLSPSCERWREIDEGASLFVMKIFHCERSEREGGDRDREIQRDCGRERMK